MENKKIFIGLLIGAVILLAIIVPVINHYQKDVRLMPVSLYGGSKSTTLIDEEGSIIEPPGGETGCENKRYKVEGVFYYQEYEPPVDYSFKKFSAYCDPSETPCQTIACQCVLRNGNFYGRLYDLRGPGQEDDVLLKEGFIGQQNQDCVEGDCEEIIVC